MPLRMSLKSACGETWNANLAQRAMPAVFELNDEVAVLGREVDAAVFPLRQDQAGYFREIGDLALDVGGLESDVAEALGFDHGVLRISSVLVR